tara:strand:- start:2600 stop:3814 length:1215 start_codon:yes stop_codon:yes gene_type:complete
VFRPASFLREAAKNGWQAAGLSGPANLPASPAGEELLALMGTGIQLERISLELPKPSWRLFPNVDGGLVEALAEFRAARRGFKDNTPDVVLCSGPPFQSFIAGYFIARYFRAQLVLDYRDEWTECPFDFVQSGRTDRVWEERLLAVADLVIFTTASQLDHHIRKFRGLDRDRCIHVPNGWEQLEGTTKSVSSVFPEKNADKIRMTFVGNLSAHTPPAAFLRTLARTLEENPQYKDRLEIWFVGNVSDSVQQDLDQFPYPDILVRTGMVPLSDAKRFMQDASILMLFSGIALERYLPGKLFEYAAAGRPIMIYGAPGEASDVVERIGLGRIVRPDDPNALKAAIESLPKIDVNSENTVADNWLVQHRRDNIASGLFTQLDVLTKKRGKARFKTPRGTLQYPGRAP